MSDQNQFTSDTMSWHFFQLISGSALVECAEKAEVSVPAASSRDLSQQATELEVTALYDF